MPAAMRALITGAAAGLARRAAVSLAQTGAYERVAITWRATSPDATLDEIRAAGAEASAHRVDFLDEPEAVAAALAAAVRESGPFDVLVHGVGPMTIARFERSDVAAYREMFDGNVRSAMQAMQAVLPAMRERRYGRIVVFGMNGSSVTKPAKAFGLHLAAKSALVALARTVALEEAGSGITVNAIEPGDIRDKSITQEQARAAADERGRRGTADDIARAVRFLVDPAGDFVTGAVLAVNGGVQGPTDARSNDRKA